MRESLVVALISDTFYDRDPAGRLTQRLTEARSLGAELALLPELAMNPWSPATKVADPDDAEELGGKRTQIQQKAVKEVGIAMIGAVLTLEEGVRRNTSVVFSASGNILGTYSKTHLPEEPGFWETSHYVPGTSYGRPFEIDQFKFGVQICSDANRPEGSHLYGAMGAQAILNPRATELATYERWRPVFIANALTSGLYFLSVNRPVPEQGVLIGGPSIAVSPRGGVLVETTEPVAVVRLERAKVEASKHLYPGYLPVRSSLYAEAWSSVSDVEAREFREPSA